MLGENDNLADESGTEYMPSRAALFLPVAIVAIGYATLLFWLWIAGSFGSGIARLSVLVLAVGVPLLVAYAALRYFTIRIQLLTRSLQINLGFPRNEPLDIPYPLIRDIRIRRGLAGRAIGTGTLVLHLSTGQKIAVCDLNDPERIRNDIEQRIDGDDPADAVSDELRTSAPLAASNQ